MMETLRALTGWVLFLVMAILAAFFWHQSDTRGKYIEELTTRIVEIDAQISRLRDEIVALHERMNENQAVLGNAGPETPRVQEGEMPAVPSAAPVPAPAP